MAAPQAASNKDEIIHRMSKKIAQLTKVIYLLNTKNDEHAYEMECVEQSYENDIANILRDAYSKIDGVRSLLEAAEKKKSLTATSNIDYERNLKKQTYSLNNKKSTHATKQHVDSLLATLEQRATNTHASAIKQLDKIRQDAKNREKHIEQSANERILKMQRDVNEAKAQFARQLHALTRMKQTVQAKEHAFRESAADAHAEEMQKIVRESNAKYNQMLEERMDAEDRLKEQLNAALSAKDLAQSDADKAKQQLLAVEKLNKQSAKVQSDDGRAQTLESELKKLRNESEEGMNALKRQFSVKLKQLKAEQLRATMQIGELKEQLADASQTGEAAKRAQERAETRADGLSTELSQALTHLKQARDAHNVIKTETAGMHEAKLREQHTKAKQREADLRAECTALREQLIASDAERAKIEAQAHDKDMTNASTKEQLERDLLAERDLVKSKESALIDAVNEGATHAADAKSWRERATRMRQERDRLQKQLNHHEQNAGQANVQWTAEKEQLSKALAEAQSERDSVQNELESSQRALEKALARSKQLKSDLAMTRDQHIGAGTALETERQSHDRTVAELEALKREYEKQKSSWKGERLRTKRDIDKYSAEITSLQSKMTGMESEAALFRENNQALNDRAEDLMAKLRAAEAAAMETRDEALAARATLQQSIAQVQQEASDQLERAMAEALAKLKAEQDERAHIEEAAIVVEKKLRAALEQESEALRAARAEMSGLRAAAAEAQTCVQIERQRGLERAEQSLKERDTVLGTEISQLRRDLAAANEGARSRAARLEEQMVMAERKHAAALTEARDLAMRDREAALREANQLHEVSLRDAHKANASTVDRMQRDYAEKLANAERVHEERVKAMTDVHIREMETKLATAIKGYEVELREKLQQEHSISMSSAISALKESHAEELRREQEKASLSHEAEVTAVRSTLEARIDTLDTRVQTQTMELANARRDLEDAKAVALSKSKEHETALDKLHAEHEHALKALESRISASATRHASEIVRLRAEHEQARTLWQQETERERTMARDHACEMARRIAEMQVRFDKREPREQDIARITELEAQCVEEVRLREKAVENMKYYKLELVNREESFNRTFGNNPKVGKTMTVGGVTGGGGMATMIIDPRANNGSGDRTSAGRRSAYRRPDQRSRGSRLCNGSGGMSSHQRRQAYRPQPQNASRRHAAQYGQQSGGSSATGVRTGGTGEAALDPSLLETRRVVLDANGNEMPERRRPTYSASSHYSDRENDPTRASDVNH